MKNQTKIWMTILPVLACFALLPAQAISPAPDGCYPNFTTAEGCGALNSLTTGAANTALGWRSLFATSDGGFNTGVGAGALVINNGSNNTAVGTAALLLNLTGNLTRRLEPAPSSTTPPASTTRPSVIKHSHKPPAGPIRQLAVAHLTRILPGISTRRSVRMPAP